LLELKNIKKTYHVGNIETKALDDISVTFRDKEFVAILGVSGSGKTTCLNIIGGLDRYDSGQLTIKGKKTSDFNDSDWDAYRNNSVGFVFQSFNLITHLNIVDNVGIGMTLSGVHSSEKKKELLISLNKSDSKTIFIKNRINYPADKCNVSPSQEHSPTTLKSFYAMNLPVRWILLPVYKLWTC